MRAGSLFPANRPRARLQSRRAPCRLRERGSRSRPKIIATERLRYDDDCGPAGLAALAGVVGAVVVVVVVVAAPPPPLCVVVTDREEVKNDLQ
jgi:hypothetical protein